MAEQDYEIWTVTVPYLSAGDLMNLYFDSKNIPAPNRMNWKDAEDRRVAAARPRRADRRRSREILRAGAAAGDRRASVDAGDQRRACTSISNKKLKGVRPHMLYQNTFYKGLDYSF